MSLLSDRALLVRPSISVWSGEVLDRTASRDTADRYKATKGQVKTTKLLIAKDVIFPIQQAADSLRRFVKAETLPWRWDGVSLLPTENYMAFTAGWRERRLLFDGAVGNLLRRWSIHVANGQKALGELAKEFEYPERDAVAYRFHAEVEMFPVPDAEDFRAQVTEYEADEIRQRMAEANENALVQAQVFMWQQMHEAVTRIVTRLSEYEKDAQGKVVKGRINDTLIGNLRQLTERLQRLNITKDAGIEAMRADLERELCAYEPDELKTDDKLRTSVRDKAQELLDQMQFMGGLPQAAE